MPLVSSMAQPECAPTASQHAQSSAKATTRKRATAPLWSKHSQSHSHQTRAQPQAPQAPIAHAAHQGGIRIKDD